MLLTIFTPVYNRAYIISQLYESLCRQTCKKFEWLVVDDGSADNIDELMDEFISAAKINIRYFKQPNGGKHTAINKGAEEANGELFFIVDSDDTLTDDAVGTILKEWEKVSEKNLCGMAFLRGNEVNGVLSSKAEAIFPQEYFIGNFIDVKYNYGSSADNAEVWATDKLRKHPFNVYPGERFMSEGMVWIRMAKEWDMLFVNKIIYICEYLEDGLTLQGKKLRFLCPKGGIEGSLETMSRHFNLKMRIKQALLYIVYSKFDGRGVCRILKCPYPWLTAMCLPGGYILYHFWKYKYFNGQQ